MSRPDRTAPFDNTAASDRTAPFDNTTATNNLVAHVSLLLCVTVTVLSLLTIFHPQSEMRTTSKKRKSVQRVWEIGTLVGVNHSDYNGFIYSIIERRPANPHEIGCYTLKCMSSPDQTFDDAVIPGGLLREATTDEIQSLFLF